MVLKYSFYGVFRTGKPLFTILLLIKIKFKRAQKCCQQNTKQTPHKKLSSVKTHFTCETDMKKADQH